MNKLIALAFFILGLSSIGFSQEKVKIKIISDNKNESSDLNWFENQVKDEIQALLRNRYEVEFDLVYGDYKPDKMATDFTQAFADPSVDIVMAIGSMSSTVLSFWGSYPKPSIAAIIIDREIQKAPLTQEGTSGVDNFAYVQSPFDIKRDIQTLYKLRPFKKLGVLGAGIVRSYIPNFGSLFAGLTKELNADYSFLDIKPTISETLAAIPEDIDAVYVLPLFDELSASDITALFNGLNQKSLPNLAMLGELMIEQGALMGFEANTNLQRMPRRLAINISKILDGENASELPVQMPTFNENLIINMASASKSGVYPDWDLMSESILAKVNEIETDRVLSLEGVISEALVKNLSYRVSQKDPLIAEKDVHLAKAELRPTVEASSSFSVIDDMSASTSFGTRGRLNWLASGTLSQIIYSEPALANVAIQKLLLENQREVFNQAELDLVLDAATVFLNVLQAKSFVRIQNENVKVTKNNLDIANAKEAVGYSGATDINRWRSELALANIDLNDAQAQLRQAQFALNQFLNYPIDDPFQTEDVSMGDQFLMVNDERILGLVKDYGALQKYADFLVEEALVNLPELKQIDFNIAAQERQKLSQKRAFYLPSLALSGQLDYLIGRYDVTLAPGVEPIDNKPTWNLGVGLQYPILQGGKRRHNLDKTQLSILQLQDQRADLRNQLELRIRSNLELAGASFARVQLSQEAAEAARKNFDIVQDSYSQGQVTITNLIDAQQATVQTDLNAINAVYQYVLDFLAVERSIGFYYFLAAPADQDAFFNRLATFLATKD